MHPVLFKIGPLSIHTYGFFIALGFLAGMFVARFEAKRYGMDPDKIMDLCFYIVIAAIVGSRLFYVFIYPDSFISDPLEVFKIWSGGLVFYGGLIGAALVLIIYIRIYRLPLGKTSDIGAVCLPLGHVFGRIGCFFAGCCYGKSCDLPWAVTFTHPDSLAPKFISLHPTQLYDCLSNLLIFTLIFLLRKHKRFDGQLFLIYVILYGVNRSVIEIFRGDFRGSVFFGILSISQVIGILSALVAAIAVFTLSIRKKS